jgi:hypothetical protein
MAYKGMRKRITRRTTYRTRVNKKRSKKTCVGRIRSTRIVKLHKKHITKRNKNKRSGGACPCSFRNQTGGNYATDITTDEFEGYPYKNEESTIVSFPGTPGVMDLKDYKEMMKDKDYEGFDPTA